MLNTIYYWICKIIQIILFMFDKNETKSCRKIGVQNILEETFSKLEKKYYKECLRSHPGQDASSDQAASY
jgi:phosphoribosylaminoimidazole carboxylase (NCAIR synthetase)